MSTEHPSPNTEHRGLSVRLSQWHRKWFRGRQRMKRGLRHTRMHALFGKKIFHRPLWKTDQRSIAGGLALGLFIAFTPTIPFQMLLAVAGAIYLKVNLPVAVAACWVTNPLTAVPIYMAAWELGRWILGCGEWVRDYLDLFLAEHGAGRYIRHSLYLWTGSLMFGAVAAAAGNGVVRLLWRVGGRWRQTHATRRRARPVTP